MIDIHSFIYNRAHALKLSGLFCKIHITVIAICYIYLFIIIFGSEKNSFINKMVLHNFQCVKIMFFSLFSLSLSHNFSFFIHHGPMYKSSENNQLSTETQSFTLRTNYCDSLSLLTKEEGEKKNHDALNHRQISNYIFHISFVSNGTNF